MQTIDTLNLRSQLAADFSDIIGDSFGLFGYEKDSLLESLQESNFFEFWFSGRPSGSFKVFLNSDGVPYVFDQYQVKSNVKKVEDVNFVLAQLVEQFRDDLIALSR